MDSIPQRQCSNCLQFKPATNEFFSLSNILSGGLRRMCKVCINEKSRQANALKRAAKLPPQGYKLCSKCQEIKPATSDYFAKRVRDLDKLRAICKTCTKTYDASRASEQYKRAKIREQENPHIVERKRAYGRHYIHLHAETVSKRKKAYYTAHPEQRRVESHRRRARERLVEGNHTVVDIELQYQRQKGKCYYCHKKVGKQYHIDHVVPLSRGGTNDPSNLVIACASCNLSKHNRLPHEWSDGGHLL